MYKALLMVLMKLLSQDVVYALAHATGKTGRFTLIERWRNNERLLSPQEHPLKVNCCINLDVATGTQYHVNMTSHFLFG
jgi:hypothetical protein